MSLRFRSFSLDTRDTRNGGSPRSETPFSLRKFLFGIAVLVGVHVLVLAGPFRGVEGTTPSKVDPESLIREAEEVIKAVDSYTAIFHKQERIEGKLMREETIFFKFKKPFKVYMKWIKPPHKGRESLYVEGENGNRIKGREGGILGLFTVNLDPRGRRAMKGNRHPITDIGLHNLVDLLAEQMKRGLTAGELDFVGHGRGEIYGRDTIRVEGIFPRDRSKGYYCSRAIIHLDLELKVPLRVELYDWDDELFERYGFEDLRLDAGLTDIDFDPENPEYGF